MSETPERPEPLVTDHALFLVWTASCDPTCWVRARPLCEALVELQGTSRQTGQMWVAEEGLPEKVNPDAIFEHVLQRFKATKGGEAKPRRLRLTPLGRDVLRHLHPRGAARRGPRRAPNRGAAPDPGRPPPARRRDRSRGLALRPPPRRGQGDDPSLGPPPRRLRGVGDEAATGPRVEHVASPRPPARPEALARAQRR